MSAVTTVLIFALHADKVRGSQRVMRKCSWKKLEAKRLSKLKQIQRKNDASTPYQPMCHVIQ